MQVVILTGGVGALLRPLTVTTPKPLLPLINQPILTFIIQQFIQQQATSIIVAGNYKSDLIMDWLGAQHWPIPVTCHSVNEYNGSFQILRELEPQLEERFIVIYADMLVDVPFGPLFQSFAQSPDPAWLGISLQHDPFSNGAYQVRNNAAVALIPSSDTGTASDGRFYFLTKSAVFDPCCRGDNVFPDLAKTLLEMQPSIPVITPHYWAVLGRLEPYLSANFTLMDQLAIAYVDPGAQVHPSAKLEAPLYIGPGCTIGANATVGPYVVLGPEVTVESEAELSQCLVMSKSTLGAHVSVSQSVVGHACVIQPHSTIAPGCIIGALTTIGARCQIHEGARVGPFLSISDHTSLSGILFPATPSKETDQLVSHGIVTRHPDIPDAYWLRVDS